MPKPKQPQNDQSKPPCPYLKKVIKDTKKMGEKVDDLSDKIDKLNNLVEKLTEKEES